MPIFEFSCNDCKLRRFSALVGVVAGAAVPKCVRCGSQNITKLVSRFSRVRSEDETIDNLADMADGIDEDDPKAMRRLMKTMASEMGEDMDADEFEAMMDEETAAGEGGSGMPDGMPGGDSDFAASAAEDF